MESRVNYECLLWRRPNLIRSCILIAKELEAKFFNHVNYFGIVMLQSQI